MTPVDRVLQHALSHPGRLGAARLVCVDGPSGSGKSTLAASLARAGHPPVQVLATDEMLPGGWGGLPGLAGRVRPVLRALASGRDGWWRRWDWVADRWAEWHRVRGAGLVVLEGVGSWHPAWADLVTTAVWLEAPRDVRLARGVARDDGLAEHWRRWQVAESALHRSSLTRRHADVRLTT